MTALEIDVLRSFGRRESQRGSAALVMVLGVLVLLTVLTLITAEVATVEQRTAANERRERQAFEAAMTGYSHALAQLFTSKTVTAPAPPGAPLAAPGGGRYAAEFCRILVTGGVFQNTLPANPGQPCTTPAGPGDARVLIYARGWSDDGTGVRNIVAVAERTLAFPANPGNPVTARGLTGIDGSGDVVNSEGRLTVWSGDEMTITNANFKTSILTPGTHASSCPNWQKPSVVESSGDRQVGMDVVDSDGNLRNLTGAQFFEAFMGYDRASYPGLVGATQVAPDSLSSMSGQSSYNQVLFSTGDTRIAGNSTFGSAGSGLDALANGYIAPCEQGYVEPQPSVIVIDGNLDVPGNVTFNGLVYVRGDLNSTGSVVVNGAVIVEGNANMTGNFLINYSSLALSLAQKLGRAATIPGSWKDWIQYVQGNPV